MNYVKDEVGTVAEFMQGFPNIGQELTIEFSSGHDRFSGIKAI